MLEAQVRERITISADAQAHLWLAAHPEVTRLSISLLSSRACCSGARVCDVRVHVGVDMSHRGSRAVRWHPLGCLQGRDMFIDDRLVPRMPAEARLTVRGRGPFRRLDLDLTGDQWAELLYPPPN